MSWLSSSLVYSSLMKAGLFGPWRTVLLGGPEGRAGARLAKLWVLRPRLCEIAMSGLFWGYGFVVQQRTP